MKIILQFVIFYTILFTCIPSIAQAKFKKKGSTKHIEDKLTKRINSLIKMNPNEIKEVNHQYTIN